MIFFVEERKIWNAEKLRLYFNNEDVEAILNIRIPQGSTRDRIAWVHASNGKYSVKSGYYQWCQQHNVDGGVVQSRGWSKLWQLKIPHKIKVFLWRLCRNMLPVRNKLRGRGVPVTIGCPMCVGEVEHLCHMFFDCKFAQECWKIVGLSFNTRDVEYMYEWLLQLLVNGLDDVMIKVSSVLWGVWFSRNKRIFL